MTTIAAEAAAPAQDGAPAALYLTDLSKTYPGTRALEGVSLRVRQSTIHALLGGNGSGKSTLIKILAGVETADSGTVRIGDNELAADTITPAVARRLGLRFVHQTPPSYLTMTVAENMAIEEGFPTRLGMVRWRALHRHAAALIDRYDIGVAPDTPMSELRPAARTMVAIARALGDGSDTSGELVLVLDEPTASLPKHEAELLLSALRRYAAAGETIVFVSHRIDEVMAIADAVTVLRDGNHVITRDLAGMTEPDLVEHILGRKLTSVFPSASARPADRPLLEVRHAQGGPLRDVSFAVHPGEIVGVAGLLGSGRTTLLRALFGDFVLDGGDLLLDGRDLAGGTVKSAMSLGVAYTPEDRGGQAAFPDLSLRENLTMASFHRHWQGWRFRYSNERKTVRAAMQTLAIKASGDAQTFSTLSGGNQQKVVLARWMQREPKLFLLDEPTQGVDVGARADLYHAIRDAVAKGCAAIVVSSDFEELAHFCDRVVVLRGGAIVREVSRPHVTASLLTEHAYANQEGSG